MRPVLSSEAPAIRAIIAVYAAGDITVVAAQHGRSHGAALRACHTRPLGRDERCRFSCVVPNFP